MAVQDSFNNQALTFTRRFAWGGSHVENKRDGSLPECTAAPRRGTWTWRKVRFALRELEGCFTEEMGLSCILRERFTKKRQRRPLGKRMQHGERCMYLRWHRSSVGGWWWETKLVSSESDPRPAVTLSNVASLLQVVETPRTGSVPVALKVEVGSWDCTGLIPTKPHSRQTVPKVHGATSGGPPRLGHTSISPLTGCSWRRKLKQHFLWETLHGLSSQTILTRELLLVTLTLHIGSSQDSSQSADSLFLCLSVYCPPRWDGSPMEAGPLCMQLIIHA